MKLKDLYSQCRRDCGPDFEFMCSLVGLSNASILKDLADKQSPKFLLDRSRQTQQLPHGLICGVSPNELLGVAVNTMGNGWSCLVTDRRWTPGMLMCGDLLYVRGTGLLNTQLDPGDQFVEPEVDSHVVTVYSVDGEGEQLTVVNPDRRKVGARSFRHAVNGFFVISFDQLIDIWDVKRPDGSEHSRVVLSISDTRR